MTFTLDTSGVVALGEPAQVGVVTIRNTIWEDLSPFEQGYVEAAFRSLFGKSLVPWPLGFSDLAPSTLSEMLADCAALISPPYVFAKDADAGRWCWEWRQQGWRTATGGPSLREQFPPIRLTLRNDGKVYQEVVS